MQFDFTSEMAKRTDEELIQVLTVDKENYLPEALAAATKEFENRKLDNGKVSVITNQLEQQKEVDSKKANEPLDLGLKIATFIFPLFPTLILSGFYKAGGRDRKARELAVWTLYGFCFYAVIAIILIVTNL